MWDVQYVQCVTCRSLKTIFPKVIESPPCGLNAQTSVGWPSKAAITSFVDRVKIDDNEIHILGHKGTLERAVLPNSGRAGGGQTGVRSLVRNWRIGRDSHSQPFCTTALRTRLEA